LEPLSNLKGGIPMRLAGTTPQHRPWWVAAAAAVFLAAAPAVTASGADAAKKTSSCVACHTDSAKLKAEAASVPQPAGSALQAGKG
jgi:mono/diheme cytochrome c family protein